MKDLEFAARLTKACDMHKAVIPAYGLGRQTVIAHHLKASQEAVRKWFTGESRPRVKTMDKLARFVNADPAWLALGIEPDMRPQDKRFFGKQTEGVVYLALGMAMIEGATCAKPDSSDPRKEFVDYYMIKDGTQVAIRTSLGRETDDGSYEFLIPHEYEQVRNIGFVHHNSSRIHMIDLDKELIDKHKEKKGGGYAVSVKSKNGKYVSEHDEWPRLNHFGELTLGLSADAPVREAAQRIALGTARRGRVGRDTEN